jgi:hypothetical protein
MTDGATTAPAARGSPYPLQAILSGGERAIRHVHVYLHLASVSLTSRPHSSYVRGNTLSSGVVSRLDPLRVPVQSTCTEYITLIIDGTTRNRDK